MGKICAMKKTASFFLCLCVLAAPIMSAIGLAPFAIGSGVLLSADEIIVGEKVADVSVGVWMTGLCDADDVGRVEISVGYDDAKLRLTGCYASLGAGKRTTYYGGALFGNFKSAAADGQQNTLVLSAQTTSDQNRLWDSVWDLNAREFAFLEFELLGSWTGTAPLSVTGKLWRRGDGEPIDVSFADGSVTRTANQESALYAYTVSGGEVTIARGAAGADRFDLPASLNGCPVTRIRDYAFHDCKDLRSISIPESVTQIGAMAFYGCPDLGDAYVYGSPEFAQWSMTYYQGAPMPFSAVLHGYMGSSVEAYARSAQFAFEPLDLRKIGDSNGDGVLDIGDVITTAKVVAGWIPGADYDLNQTDCDNSGTTDLNDVTLLAKYVAGWAVTMGKYAKR